MQGDGCSGAHWLARALGPHCAAPAHSANCTQPRSRAGAHHLPESPAHPAPPEAARPGSPFRLLLLRLLRPFFLLSSHLFPHLTGPHPSSLFSLLLVGDTCKTGAFHSLPAVPPVAHGSTTSIAVALLLHSPRALVFCHGPSPCCSTEADQHCSIFARPTPDTFGTTPRTLHPNLLLPAVHS